MSSDERSDAVEVIEFQQPDAPTALDFDDQTHSASSSQSISFGHCDEPVEEDGVININCEQKWSELTWLSISKEDSQALLDAGEQKLHLDLAVRSFTEIPDSVRFSVHAVAEDGSKRRMISEGNVFDGESLELDLEATEYYVYMARGVNTYWAWHNGSIEVDLQAHTD